MGLQNQPDELGALLADLSRRVRTLETAAPVSALQELVGAGSASTGSISASGYIPGTEVDFTLERPARVLCIGQVGGYVTFTGTGVIVVGDTYVLVQGQAGGPKMTFGGVKVGITTFHVLPLAAGTYHAGVWWDQVQAQHTALNFWDREFDVFGLGG